MKTLLITVLPLFLFETLEAMTDGEAKNWNQKYRGIASRYLEKQGLDNPQIGGFPAFDMAPHFAIWCVESKRFPGKIGWWVFAGDCPTDYVTEKGECHPREALKNLLAR